EALFEALLLRRELIEGDPFHTLWWREVGTTLHRIGEHMRDTEDFGLAAGFFQLAADIRREVAHRAAADNLAAKSSAECDRSIERLTSAAGSNALDLKSLRDELKHQATRKGDEMVMRLSERRLDPAASWNVLRVSLLQSASVLRE